MFELTIKDQVYQFNFGMGFLREINKKVSTPIDKLPDVRQNIGLRFYVSRIIDKDAEALVDVLEMANKGEKPRITRDILDSHVDSEDTDIDSLFGEVMGFLKKANATKNVVKMLVEALDEAEKKQE